MCARPKVWTVRTAYPIYPTISVWNQCRPEECLAGGFAVSVSVWAGGPASTHSPRVRGRPAAKALAVRFALPFVRPAVIDLIAFCISTRQPQPGARIATRPFPQSLPVALKNVPPPAIDSGTI